MIPRLIHPSTVTLEQTTSATPVDSDFREPIGAPSTRTVIVNGQVSEQRGQRTVRSAGGESKVSNAAGHIVFEIDALARAGITLHRGDRVTAVGSRTLAPSWRIVRLEEHAQYGGRAWHRWAFFEPEDT